MRKSVLLEEFHIQVTAPAVMKDEARERVRRVVVGRRFRRRLHQSIQNAFAAHPELKGIAFRLGW
ncbi:MAG: hypothetical protein U0744_13570 [Gemmataceae bacterium]